MSRPGWLSCDGDADRSVGQRLCGAGTVASVTPNVQTWNGHQAREDGASAELRCVNDGCVRPATGRVAEASSYRTLRNRPHTAGVTACLRRKIDGNTY